MFASLVNWQQCLPSIADVLDCYREQPLVPSNQDSTG